MPDSGIPRQPSVTAFEGVSDKVRDAVETSQSLRSTTFQEVWDAGFELSLTSWQGLHTTRARSCSCDHPLGPHVLVAAFSTPLDGGLYYCQNWNDGCPCAGTWDTNCPEHIRERYREGKEENDL